MRNRKENNIHTLDHRCRRGTVDFRPRSPCMREEHLSAANATSCSIYRLSSCHQNTISIKDPDPCSPIPDSGRFPSNPRPVMRQHEIPPTPLVGGVDSRSTRVRSGVRSHAANVTGVRLGCKSKSDRRQCKRSCHPIKNRRTYSEAMHVSSAAPREGWDFPEDPIAPAFCNSVLSPESNEFCFSLHSTL